ncbi:hypothetical protein DFQ30_008496 [Apophysomyces sp. BC1015]|nr:hypothetical protein DFQ30_008496 [Apophysomyces sp. BC1015]KAG0178615.1 hypothetical protein DFQ29_003248 [Apophysomyces sp. BC1021]
MFEPEMALFAEKLKEMNIKFYIELSGSLRRLMQCRSASLVLWLDSETSEMADELLRDPNTTELAYDEDILNDLFVFAKDVDLPIDTQDSIPLLKELGLALSVAHSR